MLFFLHGRALTGIYQMKIKILGNGGAISDGLPYNSFLIDDFFLAEAPPDLMNSLFREQVNLSKLRIVFISHVHADHYFGFPFLALRLFYDQAGRREGGAIRIIGPQNITHRIKELCVIAFGDDHPLIPWLESKVECVETGPHEKIELENDLSIRTIPMSHFIETYGFSLYQNERMIFSYFADTLWSDELLPIVKSGPGVILADLNGEPSDPVRLHLSESDLLERALPHCPAGTVFYGTHLKVAKKSGLERIKYVNPGDVIDI